jgi:hypothetical protein
MKLIYEFEFLEKDCPLVSRELVRPWRLAALAVGLGILIAGSHLNSVGTLPNDSVISPDSPHLSLFIYATFLALFARR